MLQKVKRFKDKIFGSSSGRKNLGSPESQGEEYGEGQNASPGFVGYGVLSQGSLTEMTSTARQTSRNSSISEATSSAPLSPSRFNSVNSVKRSTTGELAKPEPARSSSITNKSSSQKSSKTELAALYSFATLPGSPSAGRRKSTPPMLDTLLVNGGAAGGNIEDILGAKKLVFGQYFKGAGGQEKVAEKEGAVKRGAPASPIPDNNSSKRTATQPSFPHSTAARPKQPPTKVIAKTPNNLPYQNGTKPELLEIPPLHDLSLDGTGDATNSSQPVSTMQQPMDSALSAELEGAGVLHNGPVPVPVKSEVMEDAPNVRKTKLISVSPSLPIAMQRRNWSLADYTVIRKMYTGYASSVYQAQCNYSGEMVALKVYHLESLCELNHYQVLREIRVHAGLHHQNIIHLFTSFQEGNDVVLVQEYAENGDLYRLLHKNGGRLAERQAVEMVLAPFLHALHYLHTRGIMHRDIKPENVLFTDQWVLKLADFGLAIDLNEERAVTRAGTLDYMAPEVLRCPPKNLPQENKHLSQLFYNNSVDAWAVGVFAYELIVGYPPFSSSNQMDSVERIMHGRPDFPEKTTELARDFICQALQKHPGDRPTVMEMLHHPWVSSHQRRRSVLMAPTHRRRSSAAYTPMAVPMPTYGEMPPLPVNSEVVDINEYTPEQIEEMIRRLQMAKQAMTAQAAQPSLVQPGLPLNKPVALVKSTSRNAQNRSC